MVVKRKIIKAETKAELDDMIRYHKTIGWKEKSDIKIDFSQRQSYQILMQFES